MAVPLALIAVITVADLLAPQEIQLSPLLVTAPAITASFAGPWFTAVVSVITIADEVMLGAQNGLLGSRGMQTQLAALVVVSACLVLFAYVRDRHMKQLTQVRSVSETAQRALLRPIPSVLGPLRLASTYLAAEEEAQIGGDLYAALRTPKGARIVIGDVRGKGLPSVGDAAMLLGAFREAARRHVALADVVCHLDESVRADLEENAQECEDSGENFITAVVLDIPDGDPVVEMIDCGHPPPLLIRDHRLVSLEAVHPSPPLGLGELAEPVYQAEVSRFEVGDTLLLYTDGVIEARCPGGGFYPLAERIGSWTGEGPESLVGFLRDDLLSHVGGRLGDDAAMVAIQRLAH